MHGHLDSKTGLPKQEEAFELELIIGAGKIRSTIAAQ